MQAGSSAVGLIISRDYNPYSGQCYGSWVNNGGFVAMNSFERTGSILLVFGALVLSGCATTPPVAKIAKTRSGFPEAVFKGHPIQEKHDQYVQVCVQSGGQLTAAANPNMVVCERELSGWEAVQATLAMGSTNSNVMMYDRAIFSLASVNSGQDTFVQIKAQWSMRNAFGAERTQDHMSNADFNMLMQKLMASPGYAPADGMSLTQAQPPAGGS